jgi:hypothetical protein
LTSRGLRSLLQPILYVGIAALLHGLVLLIPVGGVSGKPDSQTTRGIRVRAYVDAPATPRSGSVPKDPTTPMPPVTAGKNQSTLGNGGQPAGSIVGGNPAGPPGPGGGAPGAPGGEPGSGDPPLGVYDQYLAKLRSEDVQGWARESSKNMRQGWKGTGSGTGPGGGWGPGAGRGGGGKGALGGKGSGGSGYLDPRVRMVVTSYPSTGIDRRYTVVPYPEIKVKKSEYTSGWWNVYIEILTDANGNITKYDVLRPETGGALEKLFVEQVRKEIARWSFDPTPAEIHVDVRFHVE